LKLKYQICLLILFSICIGDSVIYKFEGKKYGKPHTFNKEITGKNLGTFNGNVNFRDKLGEIHQINCSKVISIYDKENNKLPFDCSEDTFNPYYYNSEVTNTAKKIGGNIGGLFIAIGSGFLLYDNNQYCSGTNCDSYEEINEFYDDLESRRNIGYGLIMFGGFLILVTD
jgi:hypothetical protein